MPETFRPEYKEILSSIELKVVDPVGDKNFMVAFDGKTEAECRAYNNAIAYVLKKEGLRPFHQMGTTPNGQHEPGHHAWEIWSDATREKLEALLPQIETEAKVWLEQS